MPSYEKSKASGLWSARFRETDKNGITHQKRLSGFKTKKEAQFGYENYITQVKAETDNKHADLPASSSGLTFDEVFEKFKAFKKARLKASSFYDLDSKMTNRILPFFTGRTIEEITPAVILEWMQTIQTYSYKYQKDLFHYLVALYSYADKYHDIKNIMKKVDAPRNLEPKKEMLIWTPEEFRQFISEVDRPEFAILYKFLYVSGCRRGEAEALHWDDLDLKRGEVRISKTLEYKVGSENKPYSITPPKTTGSNRVIQLPRFIVEDLKEYKRWQAENVADTTFVFGGADPLPPTSVDRRLRQAAERAGVKKIRIHDFRHSCASYLINNMSNGVTIIGVSQRLGHTSVKQTLDTYAHLMPKEQGAIVSALENLKF